MEWLKDPKNQPKVAVGLSVFIVLMGLCIWWFGFRQPSPDTGSTTAPPGTTAPGEVPQGSTSPTAPRTIPSAATTPAAPAAPTQVASAKPMETWRDDPFMPLGYKPPRRGPKPRPPISDFPFITLPARLGVKGPTETPELAQPARRMAGILVNDRIYAIIESNGQSQIVQPGDVLNDRMAVVDKIERDKVVLKTKDKKPRYIIVRMAASPRGQVGQTDAGSPANPPPGPVGAPRGRTGRPVRDMGPESDFH